MSTVINCTNLTKAYKNKEALSGLNLSIGENKMIGLIGRNGAGKTTFLKTCAGYILPTSGNLTVLGGEPFDNLDVLSNMIFIDEEVSYNASLKLGELLKIGQIYYKNWDNGFAKKLIKYFDLNEKQKYKKLSRGMKTQFNMIMGLASRSPLTLMDEPTLGLDVAVRKEFYSIMLKDYMENPRTFIISSHLMSELENMLEEMILIHKGKLVFQKSIEELQGYALLLNGKEEILKPFLSKKQVLNTESFGNSILAGVVNDLKGEEMAYLENNNVDISAAKIDDVYIWLTKNEKGGGFDEFEG
ncbi:MAG TPA: ABC transporter ATP-binding protein [Clostridia bacterium]|nr:ABC transporter ATP-binding protein [Clostridia bacterium]